MRNLTKALTVVSLLAPVSSYSLGIGDIRVRSALNQNLNAEISLIVSPNENPNSIKVNLAPPERFDSAGVAWSYFLSKIRFKPIVKPNGSVVIKVTSTEALKEPYLNFLLEVSWPKGNLYREFTVLVDPPAEYQEPASRAEPSYETYAPQENVYSSRPRYAASRPAIKRAVRPRYRAPANPAGNFGGQITARRNDTLWKVAARAKGGSSVSVEQMMMALYDRNRDAFYQANVNALSAGKTLNVPAKDEVQNRSREDALAEFGRHNQAWQNHEAVPPSQETTQAAKQEPADNQLKLVAPTESSVSGAEKVTPSSEQGAASQAQPAASASGEGAQKAGTAKPAVDDAVQSKIDALQKQLETMQQIIALKDKQLSDLQNANQEPAAEKPPVAQQQPVPPIEPKAETKPTEKTPVEPVPPVAATPAQPVKPVEPVKPVKPAVTQQQPVVKPVLTPEPVAKESDSSFMGIIAATALAFMGILGWIWWRKQKMLAEIDAESMFGNYSMMRQGESSNSQPSGFRGDKAAAGAAAGTLADESSFLNDFKASDFESFETFNVDHGDIDPVAEADVYLAYGRYQQAEELMKQAVQDSPDRDECKLKLLEIYQVSGNKDAFERYASELASAGKREDTDFWDKAIEFSKEIGSDAEIFAHDYRPSVFTRDPALSAENILVSHSPRTETKNSDPEETSQPVQKSEEKQSIQIGAATFEVDPSLDEESTFASAIYRPSSDDQHGDDLNYESTPSNFEQDSEESGLFEAGDRGVRAEDDVNSVDFDLRPYPGNTLPKAAEEVEKTEGDLFSATAQGLPSDDALAKHELDAYEFDFDFEKPELGSAASSIKTPVDAWDPDQTLDYPFEGEKVEDNQQNLSLDFNLNLEALPESLGQSTNEKGEFNLSDLTDMDEVETKLDLAKAYIDMGDSDSAKDIIDQILESGSDEQKKMANELLKELI